MQNDPTTLSRRDAMGVGARALAIGAIAPSLGRGRLAPPVVRRVGPPLTPSTRALIGDDPALTALAMRAVEQAKAAGASYADARLTYIRTRVIDVTSGVTESEFCHVGVRALVNGYWGFATHPYWVPDAITWLGREAVAQAKLSAGGPTGPVELTAAPRAFNGRWATPTQRDPFAIPVEEAWSRFHGFRDYCTEYLMPPEPAGAHTWGVAAHLGCWQEQAVFASSDGNTYVQTRTRATPFLQVACTRRSDRRITSSSPAPFLREAGGGLDAVFDEPRILAWIPKAVEEIRMLERLPDRRVEVGRYDMIWDAPSVGNLLGGTLGCATQMDRILGIEANAGGTSYLGDDPLAVLDTQVAAPLVTITADRTRASGLATVGWDAEGVAPEPYPLVKNGVLVDLQATRAQAATLAPYYQKAGLPTTSKGGADADSAGMLPLTHTPNLVLEPGPEALGLEQMVAGLSGLLIRDARFTTDFQAATAVGQGDVFKVKHGQLAARVLNAAVPVWSREVWPSVQALGGPESVEAVPLRSIKGEPRQQAAYTVWAVPARMRDVTVLEATSRRDR